MGAFRLNRSLKPALYSSLLLLYLGAASQQLASIGRSLWSLSLWAVVGATTVVYFLLVHSNPGVVTSSNMDSLARPLYIQRFFARLDKLARGNPKPPETELTEVQRFGKAARDLDLMSTDKKAKSDLALDPTSRPRLDDKIFDGLKDEDREKTDYGDEYDPDGPDLPGSAATLQVKTAAPGVPEETAKTPGRESRQEQAREEDKGLKSTLPGGQFELSLEKHFCAECNVDQPIRTKHCRDCGSCVATFDHHCFWIGNCIGEKNRPLFFVYLNLQVLEMAYLLWRPLSLVQSAGDSQWRQLYPLAALLGVYFILLLCLVSLVGYHYYFLCANVTTWEHLSWVDISYLEGFDRHRGSPFSLGLGSNVSSYLCPPKDSFYEWVPVKSRKV